MCYTFCITLFEMNLISPLLLPCKINILQLDHFLNRNLSISFWFATNIHAFCIAQQMHVLNEKSVFITEVQKNYRVPVAESPLRHTRGRRWKGQV